MRNLADDLRRECLELATLLDSLTPEQWRLRSQFYGWTAIDEISHLLFFDERGLLAMSDPEAFASDAALIDRQMSKGREMSALARDAYGQLSPKELITRWRSTFTLLAARLAEMDPKARLPWYGPPMSARSFVTARLMETWAHGQDVFDLVSVKRLPTLRLKHIAHLGVSTFAWSFVNRGLDVPSAPYVALHGPSGEEWSWGSPSVTDFVHGPVEDFCLAVTQRRNVKDTHLSFSGTGEEWLTIAQCFAGPPADPPPVGARVVRYDYKR